MLVQILIQSRKGTRLEGETRPSSPLSRLRRVGGTSLRQQSRYHVPSANFFFPSSSNLQLPSAIADPSQLCISRTIKVTQFFYTRTTTLVHALSHLDFSHRHCLNRTPVHSFCPLPGPSYTMADPLTDVLEPSADQFTSCGPTMPSWPAAQPELHLVKLPREVLDNVAKFLPTPAFNNMRLTCKVIENNLFEYWSNCFFRKKQFSKFCLLAAALLTPAVHMLTVRQ